MNLIALEEDLRNDPYEQMVIKSVEKSYLKQKRKNKTHSLTHRYNGFENEKRFHAYIDYLYESGYLQYFKWDSYHSKGEIDFTVTLKSFNTIYFDVVGTHERAGHIALNTKTKDYRAKLKAFGCHPGYLAFELNGSWRFLQVSRHLPKGDICMSKGRNKHVKKPGYVFEIEDIPGNIPDNDQNLLSNSERNMV